jgi:hypothetical protein
VVLLVLLLGHSLAVLVHAIGPPYKEVDIDIKPGGEPNSINLGSKGIVPVAILATEHSDPTTVDPATVVFAGASPLRWAWEDVDLDGDMDLVFFFKTQELALTECSIEANLTGSEFDGIGIDGWDTVNIVPKAH